jgi:hypothetical protein
MPPPCGDLPVGHSWGWKCLVLRVWVPTHQAAGSPRNSACFAKSSLLPLMADQDRRTLMSLMAERVRLLAAGDGRSSSASLRTAAARPRRPKIAPRFLSNSGGLTRAVLSLALRAHCVRPNSLLRICRPLTPHLQNIKSPRTGLFIFCGGEGEITRRFAPRPYGAALRALSSLRCCQD